MNNKLRIFIAIFGLFLLLTGSWILMKGSYVDEEYKYIPTQTEALRQDSGSSVNKTQTAPSNSPNSNLSGYPVRIVLPDVNIDIGVAKGYYNSSTKKWTISRDKAYYAVMTKRPNTEGGNTFIYGHNRSNVFSRLLKIRSGSIATVTTDNNKKFVYQLERFYTTNPNDSGILYYEGDPILTLQTCSGANFQNRTLYIFKLIKVTNA